MDGKVSFKVYLLNGEEPDKPEIRRFGIDQDVVTNFLYLREKLVNIFPSLRGRHFTISWRDDEKDDIIISGDDDLSIALSETASHPVRKIYVSVHSEYPKGYTNPGRTSGIIHDGITCDGCEKPVQGYRYKCLQCIDYDLCACCEAQGLHEDHCMLRLTVPAQWKPHWGRKIAGLMNRSVRKASTAAEKEEEGKCPFSKHGASHGTKHGAEGHHGKHRGKQHKRHCSEDGPSWANSFASYLNEWANLPGECPMKEKPAESEQKNPSEDEPRAKSPRMEYKNSVDQYVELLKMFGENFTPFLETFVNPQPKNDMDVPEPQPGTSKEEDPKKNEDNGPNKPTVIQSDNPEPKNEKKNAEIIKEPVVVRVENGNEATGVEKSSDNEGWTIIGTNPNAIPIETDAKEAVPTAPVDPVSTSKGIYPDLPKQEKTPVVVQKEIYHPDLKIQQAMESMIQMGFSNEGGWLTNLLVSMNGDIVRALDALSPASR